MGLFGNKKNDSGEKPLYESNYVGFWIKVYPNRVEFKTGAGSESVAINQIASISIPMMGIWKVTIETSGGKKYSIPTNKKKEVQRAIYDAQARFNPGNSQQSNSSVADEITKLNDLKEKGIISQEDFDAKKKQLLGI